MKKQENKPRVWTVDAETPLADLVASSAHGDLVFDPAGGSRSLGVKFVNALGTSGKPLKHGKLVQRDTSGSGYCSVPVEVTRHFADPVARYLPSLAIDSADGDGVSLDDWLAIELDGDSHAEVLEQQTGGRAVDTGRRIVYFVSDFGAGTGYSLWNPLFPGEDDGMSGWKPLDAETPDEYLGKSIYRERGAKASKTQERNRTICEDHLLAGLEGKDGAMVTLVSIPETIDNFREAGGQMTNATLLSIDAGDLLPDIRVDYTEWAEDPKSGEIVPRKHELVFAPTVLSTDGPFGNVHFWINREFNWMLSPPSK